MARRKPCSLAGAVSLRAASSYLTGSGKIPGLIRNEAYAAAGRTAIRCFSCCPSRTAFGHLLYGMKRLNDAKLYGFHDVLLPE